MDLIDRYNESNLFGKENNLILKVLDKGHIEYQMKLEEKHMALSDVVHGGAIAGLMDAVLSVAAFSQVADENKQVATVEFKINYLKSVKKKSILKGIGTVIKNGERLMVTKGEIFDEKGDLVAIGTGTIIPFQKKN